jgi:hypothetical protein
MQELYKREERAARKYDKPVGATAVFENSIPYQNWVIDEVSGDGNCLFRSVAKQIYGSEERHAELRKLAADHMRSHIRRYETFFAEDFLGYLEQLRKDKTWAGELEIRALEEVLDQRIVVLTVDATGLFKSLPGMHTHVGNDRAEYVPQITIICENSNHFNSLMPGPTPEDPVPKYESMPRRTTHYLRDEAIRSFVSEGTLSPQEVDYILSPEEFDSHYVHKSRRIHQ